MPQQFAQQNQLRGQQIRSPITATAQQIISTTIPTGQPRVFMKAQSQYSITQQQQFEQQQQQSPQTAQFIRAQTPSQPQLQFIRNPQWQPQSQDTSAPSQQQQLTSIRPQHILVATQPQPTQQQIMQWQQQQQDIQRRQLMQQQQQQQQNPQRFQLTSAIQPEKVRPTVSVVSVSSANTETQSAQLASAATTASTVRIAQTPIPPNIALSGNHSVAQQSVNPNPVSTANTTPNATIACPIVNPKTKTALANLLNNRLQSGNTGANKGDGGNSSSDGSPSNVSGSLSLSSSTSTLPNKTGFIGSPGVVRKECYCMTWCSLLHELFTSNSC
jgi:PAX-interacting protein 1